MAHPGEQITVWSNRVLVFKDFLKVKPNSSDIYLVEIIVIISWASTSVSPITWLFTKFQLIRPNTIQPRPIGGSWITPLCHAQRSFQKQKANPVLNFLPTIWLTWSKFDHSSKRHKHSHDQGVHSLRSIGSTIQSLRLHCSRRICCSTESEHVTWK